MMKILNWLWFNTFAKKTDTTIALIGANMPTTNQKAQLWKGLDGHWYLHINIKSTKI